ncbi:hypothetical protein K7X08_019888 [Anisodus acutangulus]|uniref:Uncharacterized protein n=1 Tax=Anisodus acutangulus TaxID=402998 RepID=A0A9Q1MSC3_9SOLA|nr:hypothetical protein K7X08_019888 [Anisodus acutangulus]
MPISEIFIPLSEGEKETQVQMPASPDHLLQLEDGGAQKLHPTTQRVEEELNKLKSLKIPAAPKADTVYNGLLGLEKLYKCIDDLRNLPQTLSQGLNAKWVNNLLDKSVRLLDVCGTIRELVSQCKDNVRDLQSSLRRRKGDSTTDESVERFTSFINKIKRDAKRLVSTLKQMDQETAVSVLLDADQDTLAVIRALKEANAIGKQRMAPLVLEENMSKETRLESFEAYLVSFEDGLEATFRCLIRSRSPANLAVDIPYTVNCIYTLL